MGHSLKPNQSAAQEVNANEINLKEVAGRLLTLSRNFEAVYGQGPERWSQPLGKFDALQNLIRDSVQKLTEVAPTLAPSSAASTSTQTPTQAGEALPAKRTTSRIVETLATRKSLSTPRASSRKPAPTAVAPSIEKVAVKDFGSSQTSYQPAIQDADVIQALLDLHEQVQTEKAIQRDSSLGTALSMAPSHSLSRQPAGRSNGRSTSAPEIVSHSVPQVMTDTSRLQFSRTNQGLSGSFSPILKPPRKK